MSFKITGKIKSIGEIQSFDSGAKKIQFVVETSDQYNNIYAIDMFKSGEHVKHVENFSKYHKVGDECNVEINVNTNEFKNKYYTSLSAWKIEKVDKVNSQPVAEKFIDEDDDLPF